MNNNDKANEHTFDEGYWEEHWAGSDASKRGLPANPYLAEETGHLKPSDALDAGCGTGAETIWLAEQGWRVTGADISPTALAAAQDRAHQSPANDRIEWVEADLTEWQPEQQFDLVVTSYAHPSIPQLEFYRHVSEWVTPGGILLIVAHQHESHEHDQEHDHNHHHSHGTDDFPPESTVTVNAVVALFDSPEWLIETARAHSRTVDRAEGPKRLDDVIVRVRRSIAPVDA